MITEADVQRAVSNALAAEREARRRRWYYFVHVKLDNVVSAVALLWGGFWLATHYPWLLVPYIATIMALSDNKMLSRIGRLVWQAAMYVGALALIFYLCKPA